jgi:hypothetical protein
MAPAASKLMAAADRLCFTLIASFRPGLCALSPASAASSLSGQTPISTHVEIYSDRNQRANKHQMNWLTPLDECPVLISRGPGIGRRG